MFEFNIPVCDKALSQLDFLCQVIYQRTLPLKTSWLHVMFTSIKHDHVIICITVLFISLVTTKCLMESGCFFTGLVIYFGFDKKRLDNCSRRRAIND